MNIDSKRNMIEKIAQLVREKLELSTPVDLNEAVERLGGKCVAVSTDEYDAKIEKADSDYQFRINYAKCMAERHRRHAIAREIYYLFGRYSKQEADEFAASLLMPRREFIIYINSIIKDNKVDLQDVANYFAVSVQAARIRAADLHI